MSSSVGSFFKVILSSTLHQGKLKIPSKFVKEHWEELSESVRLFIPTGRSWCVGVERDIDKTIWLRDGLLKFMEENSIGVEYFLIFKYEGNSMFNVLIFDLTATEINYIYNSDPEKCSDADQIQEPDTREGGGNEDSKEMSIEFLTSSTDHLFPQISEEPNKSASRNKRWKCVTRETDNIKRCYLTRRKKHKLNGGTEAKNADDCFTAPRSDMSGQSYKRMKKTSDSYKDLRKTYDCGSNLSKFKDTKKSDGKYISLKECAEERTNQPDNMSFPSSFEVTLKSFNIEKHILHIPKKFTRLNMPNSSCFIKLLDADDNEWVVHCICHEGYNNLTKGWMCFVRDKKLMVGDVCVFERMGGEEVRLKVNIYRSLDHTQLPIKEGGGDEGSKGKSIEFGLGSSTDHLFPQISEDPSKSASRNKQWKCVTPETDDSKDSYVTRIRKQKLNGGTEAKIADDFFTLPRRDISRQSYERIHKTGGKNSSKFKDTRMSDGRYVSPKECAEERTCQAENTSFPTSFEVTLKTYNLEKHILHVPKKFARLNMPHSSSFIKLRDVEDNEWVVLWNCHGYTGTFSKGWIHFARDKKLMVGDTCVFERIGGSEVKLKVNIIYRSAEINYTCGRDSPQCSYADQIQVPDKGEGGGDEGSKGKPIVIDDIKQCYATRIKKQKLNGGTEAKIADDCFTPPRRDMSGQSYERMHKTSEAYKDGNETYNCPGGNNSSKFKDTRMSDGRYVSPKECAEERTDQAENMSFPTSFEVTLKTYNLDKYILNVPKQFAKLNMPRSSSLIKFLDVEDNEWVVHWNCQGNSLNLTTGWIHFARDKKLMVGDVCVFERMGGSEVKLKVNIYRSAEINYTRSSNSPKCSYSDQIQVPDTGEGGADEGRKTYNCPGGNNSSKYKDTKKSDGSYTSPKEYADKRTDQAESISSLTSFEATMKTYNIEKHIVTVPRKFARLNFPDSTSFVKLLDADDNEYVVRCGIQNNLSQGWIHFVRDKKLMVGDVCIFERIEGREVKLKVNVYRSADMKNPIMYKDTARDDGTDASPNDLVKKRTIEAENKSDSLLYTDMKNSIMCKDTARDDGTNASPSDASPSDLVKERTLEAENKYDSLLCTDIMYKDTARNDCNNASLSNFVKERTIEAENKSAS